MTPAKLAETYDRALALQRAGDVAAADQLFTRILLAKPNHAGALLRRGEIALQAGDAERGVGLVRKAVGFGKTDPDLLSEGGNLLLAAGEPETALAAFEAALDVAPDEPAFLVDRGNGLSALRRWGEALVAYDQAAARDPGQPVAHANRGNALLRLGCAEEALAAHDRAAALAPDDPRARMNRAESLAALGRREEALADLDLALKLALADAQIEWNRSLLLLQLGRFEEGWAAYEARKRTRPPIGVIETARPEWDGADPAGKTLLLHAEQGFGDTLQFCRYASLAAARGANVVLQVQAPLTRLLSSLGPAIRVIGEDEPAPTFDLHAPLMSLPRIFGTTLATIPAETPYLAADRALAAQWTERLGPRGGRPRAGLVWRGARGHANDLNRSLPPEALAALLAAPVEFVALQPDITPEEAAPLDAAGARSIGEGFGDFADTAAAVAALDVVVSVDTSAAHLAGALGKPVFVLLPFNPDWRWLIGRDDSPWYPSARLFRQPQAGDWASVVDAVAEALS